MIVKEYRVTLPMTVDEYQVAQLFSVAEASKENTGGGEGIEVLKNEPFDNFPLLDGEYSKGQYTHKIYHIASKVPGWLRMFIPKGCLEIHEEAWNAYPYCRTVLTNPLYMKTNFRLCIESLHVNDNGSSENVHRLQPDALKNRSVVHIDIANDDISAQNYNKDEDPKLYKSQKTSRGPLVGNWQQSSKPIMTCYKLVTVEFKWFGLQNRVENYIHKVEQQLFFNFHRKVFCSMDKWHGMTMADIRAIEDKTKRELDAARHEGDVRGMKTADE